MKTFFQEHFQEHKGVLEILKEVVFRSSLKSGFS